MGERELPYLPPRSERAKSTIRYMGLDPENQFGGDWGKLLGKECNVSISIGQGKGDKVGMLYENIMGVMPMREKDIEGLPELQNPSHLFDLDEPTMIGFLALPEFVQRKIMGGIGFGETAFGIEVFAEKKENPPAEEEIDNPEGEIDDDEIPF